jgi:hypothetical protein
MLDYIEWSKAHGQTQNIVETVIHDLRGRNERFMSPRTSSYLKNQNQESDQ